MRNNHFRILTRTAGLILALCISGVGLARGSQAEHPAASGSQAQATARMTDEERADVFMARKEYDDAIDYYKRALRDASDRRADIWNKMGIAYQQESDLKKARKSYKTAIHFDRTLAPAWNNMGTTYYLSGNAKKSIKYYRHAVRLKPSDASLHLNLGTAYYARKKYKQAVEEYHAALVLDPDVLSQYSENGTIVEARKADAEYYFYLAKAFASLGRAKEAVLYLAHAMEDGYKNYRKIQNDPDFQKIKNYPAYVELLKNPPKAIKD